MDDENQRLIVPLSRRTDPAFLNASVCFYRVVERVTSKRAAVQRVLLVSPRGVVYVCHLDGRVTRTVHCSEIKWIRTQHSTMVWCTQTGAQTMVSFRMEHVSNIPLCNVDYFVQLVQSFGPHIKHNSEEALKAPLALEAPANKWTEMLQGVRLLRKVDEDTMAVLNQSHIGRGHEDADADKKPDESRDNRTTIDGDDEFFERSIFGSRKKRPPPVVMLNEGDDTPTPVNEAISSPSAAAAAGAAPSAAPANDGDKLSQERGGAAAAAAAAPDTGAGAGDFGTGETLELEEGGSGSDDDDGDHAPVPLALSKSKSMGRIVTQNTRVAFARVDVTRSTEKSIGVGFRTLEVDTQAQRFVFAAQSGSAHPPLTLELAEVAFPNSRDFTFVLAAGGGGGGGAMISGSWENAAPAQLQKLTSRFLRKLRGMYPNVRVRTGSAASQDLMHLSSHVTSLSKRVGDLHKAATNMHSAHFREEQERALTRLLYLICTAPKKHEQESAAGASGDDSQAAAEENEIQLADDE